MGQILGIGTTHSPPLAMPGGRSAAWFKEALRAPGGDVRWRDPAAWPAAMVAEFGDDDGLAASLAHRQRLIDNFRRQRQMIDAFKPDFIIITGDDQYENFQEDIIPPFCIFGLDDPFVSLPWSRKAYDKGNAWNEPRDWAFKLRGHRDGAKYLTTALIDLDVVMPYAYKPLHQSMLATAFTNTLAYLDWDRRGFDHPVVPLHVNCYGSDLLKARGHHRARLFAASDATAGGTVQQELPDPPSPSARLCMRLGAQLAHIIMASPYRVVLMASSSWSHAGLSANTGLMVPDHASDRRMLQAFVDGDADTWRNCSRAQLEAAGQHELLNWHILVGAMDALGRTPVVDDYAETYLFQANKIFAHYPLP